MAQRRGLLAEAQRQYRIASREREMAERLAIELQRRNAAAARRTTNSTDREIQRAEAARQRAVAAEQRQLARVEVQRAKEMEQRYKESRKVETQDMNEALRATYAELDSLLSATLAVDDYVDLDKLRAKVKHPRFPRPDLRVMIAPPLPVMVPPAPVRDEVEKVSGLFGRKKREAEATARVQQKYETEYRQWQNFVASIPTLDRQNQSTFAALEKRRKEELQHIEEKFDAECKQRVEHVRIHNEKLDELKANLAYGAPDAVNEYVGIVLANSVYPDNFEVEQDFGFDNATAEMALKVSIPTPDAIPTVKEYRYVAASDEITSTVLSQKDQKDRYSEIVNQIALRSLHEVFEADRREIIKSISLQVGTTGINPGTGRKEFVPFIAVSTSRAIFMQIDLSAVVPAATLVHLGASMSKNPLQLVPAAVNGVRRS